MISGHAQHSEVHIIILTNQLDKPFRLLVKDDQTQTMKQLLQ